jgi:hypothetical protein
MYAPCFLLCMLIQDRVKIESRSLARFLHLTGHAVSSDVVTVKLNVCMLCFAVLHAHSSEAASGHD